MTTRRLYVPPFRVDITVRDGVPPVGSLRALARVVGRALDAASAPRPASIGLVLSDDRELADLNAAHLGGDGPTDVISFPLLQPDAFPSHEGEPPDRRSRSGAGRLFVLPPGARPHLGDVVVSVERAIAQAGAGRGGQTGHVRWSGADELRLLAVHGALHVCGWDHVDASEGAAMRALERRILAGAG